MATLSAPLNHSLLYSIKYRDYKILLNIIFFILTKIKLLQKKIYILLIFILNLLNKKKV